MTTEAVRNQFCGIPGQDGKGVIWHETCKATTHGAEMGSEVSAGIGTLHYSGKLEKYLST
jgi:hypothetical protein